MNGTLEYIVRDYKFVVDHVFQGIFLALQTHFSIM